MAKQPESFSILDIGITAEGTLSFKGKMIIKGNVSGTLVGETLVIGEEGSVHAETKADNVTIGGVFEGQITVSNKLTILSTGSCSGDIFCKDLVVEPGGVLNAKVTRLTPGKAQSNEPNKSPKKGKK